MISQNFLRISRCYPRPVIHLFKLTFMSLFFLVSGCSDLSPNQQNCEPWAEISRGEYLLTNNVWGAKDNPDIQQCIGVNNKGFEWSWDWKGENGNVLAYPSILYGHKPWNEQSTTERLPIQVNQLKKLNVIYKATQKGTGSHNLLLEAWLTRTAIPSDTTRTTELAIHLSQQNWPGMPGKKVDTIVVDRRNYDVFFEPSIDVPGDSHHWAYLGFVYTGKPINSGNIDIIKFVNYSKNKEYISQNHYLASIELGSELVSGSGKTRVETFNVKF